jgi:hypothetical protein
MLSKRIYMRIGSDKAGTVSLANLVVHNKDTFLKHGMYAPIRNCIPVFDYFIKKGHLNSINTFDSSDFLSKKNHMQLFKELMDQYEERKQFDIFLTTETFWGRLSKKNIEKCRKDIKKLSQSIKEYFKYHQVIIILNLRRIDLYIESLYKQEIKAGRHLTISQLKNHLTPEKPFGLLLLLEEVFGKENIIIRPFERSQMIDGDLVADTLKILKLYSHIDDFKIKIKNEGLHRDLCETLLILNKEKGKLISNKQLIRLSGILKNEYKFKDVKYILSLDERKKLIANYESFYRYLGENYSNGTPFFAEPLPGDEHLEYFLSKDHFEIIKKIIYDIKKNETTED